MIKNIGHIFDHFDFDTFPDKEVAKTRMGTRFKSDDLVVFYEDCYIPLNQVWNIVNSKKNAKVTFKDFKKS